MTVGTIASPTRESPRRSKRRTSSAKDVEVISAKQKQSSSGNSFIKFKIGGRTPVPGSPRKAKFSVTPEEEEESAAEDDDDGDKDEQQTVKENEPPSRQVDRPIQKLRLNFGKIAIQRELIIERSKETTHAVASEVCEAAIKVSSPKETPAAPNPETPSLPKKRGRKPKSFHDGTSPSPGLLNGSNSNVSGGSNQIEHETPFSAAVAMMSSGKRRPGRPLKRLGPPPSSPLHSTPSWPGAGSLSSSLLGQRQRQTQTYSSSLPNMPGGETEDERRSRLAVREWLQQQVQEMLQVDWNSPFSSPTEAIRRLYPFYVLPITKENLEDSRAAAPAPSSKALEELDELQKRFSEDLLKERLLSVPTELVVLEQRLCLEEERFLYIKLKNEYAAKQRAMASSISTNTENGSNQTVSPAPLNKPPSGTATPTTPIVNGNRQMPTSSMPSGSIDASPVHRPPKLLPKNPPSVQQLYNP